jgi:glycosyltransferase involved in cell wall biosynthesis
LTRTLPTTWRLYRAVRGVRPDLVHANDAIFISRPALAAAWLAGAPAFCHVRSLAPWGFWDHLWARTVARFIYISAWVAADQHRCGAPTGRGRVIHNGVDLALYSALPDRGAARAALGLPPDRPIVALAARFERWKGQELFLRSLRQVIAAVPNVLGLVVGDGTGTGQGYADELAALAAELGLRDAVRFTGYCGDMPVLLAAVDVLAHTSISPEPFGRVLIEAMAAGRPVVTPAEGGGLEIVADGVTGLLYTPRDPAALAAALLRLLGDPALAAAFGAAGRARVAERFSIDAHAAAVSALYREWKNRHA